MIARIFLAALAAAAALALAPAAAAGLPGQNGRVAFTAGPDYDLYVVQPDGSDLRRLTRTRWAEQSPSWSPDASRLAYESGAEGRWRIHVMGADGGGDVRVSPDATDGVDDVDPSWSPDGQRLVFASTRPFGDGWRLWVMNADGSGLRRLTDGFAVQPAWSPDGSRVAYAWGDGVYVVDADGGPARRVSAQTGAPEGSPTWSPDGSTIVFSRFLGGRGELFAVGADGSNERQLTGGGFANANPSFSPEGTQLVFQRRVGDGWRLFVAAADGSDPRPLVDAPVDQLTPDWGVFAPVPPPRDEPGAPTIHILSPEPGAMVPSGYELRAIYFCSSETAPVVRCEGDVPLGEPLDTRTAGLNTFTVVAEDVEGRRATASVQYTVLDFTRPTVTVDAPADGATYDLGAEVQVTYSCSDGPGGSGVVLCDGELANGAPLPTYRVGRFEFHFWAVDAAGNHVLVRTAYEVVDRQPPAVSIASPLDGAVYVLGQTVLAGYDCADQPGGAGLVSCAGDVQSGSPLDTSSVGAHTFTVHARDGARNEASASAGYRVVYPFEGFGAPLVPFPGVASVDAGETVPVKFGLGGDRGREVFAPGSPAWRPCGAHDSAPAAGTLSYNPGAERYLYLWETDEAWAGTCRELVVTLRDGTVHRARFVFER